MYNDPFRKENHLLILCECYDDAECKTPNSFNYRNELAYLSEKYKSHEPWTGIEQEFVLYDCKRKTPYGWLDHKEPGWGP